MKIKKFELIPLNVEQSESFDYKLSVVYETGFWPFKKEHPELVCFRWNPSFCIPATAKHLDTRLYFYASLDYPFKFYDEFGERLSNGKLEIAIRLFLSSFLNDEKIKKEIVECKKEIDKISKS